jgi:Glutamate/Leucine/Phenylalanine/Valine dehydrogenase
MRVYALANGTPAVWLSRDGAKRNVTGIHPVTSNGYRICSTFGWDEREVNDRLGRIMRKAFREVSARSREDDVPLRTAAYALGIERVVGGLAHARIHRLSQPRTRTHV